MKPFLTLLICGLLAAGCVAPSTPAEAPAAAAASKGNDFSDAVKITAKDTVSGIRAEYDWVAANRPGWKVTGQMLVDIGGKPFDVLVIQKGAETDEVYFDISSFFGKI
jgi:hypothetical protein